MNIYDLAKKEHPIIGIKRRAFVEGAKAVLEELKMTISVSEEGYLLSNLKKLINQLEGKDDGENSKNFDYDINRELYT